MKDYIEQLHFYAFPESIKASEQYLQNYWLNWEDYLSDWKSIQDMIFKPVTYLPDWIFQDDYLADVQGGGEVLNKNSFSYIKELMQIAQDSFFAIIEQPPQYMGQDYPPPLRFKYPSTIEWEDLIIGDGITTFLQIPSRFYYLFGNTGTWGQYIASDWKYPLEILGYKIKYFNVMENIWPKVGSYWKGEMLKNKDIPDIYKKYIR